MYALTLGIILLSLTLTNVARADSEEEQLTRRFLAGAGLLCSLPPSPEGPACPDIARAANGDTVAISGSGKFEPGDDDASGRGTFTHRNSAGVVLASGKWKVKELVSFKSFGLAGAGFPPGAEGGVAVLQIELRPSSGGKIQALLTINCVLGSPPEGVEEGIQLNVGFINFDHSVSGFTLFIQVADD